MDLFLNGNKEDLNIVLNHVHFTVLLIFVHFYLFKNNFLNELNYFENYNLTRYYLRISRTFL